MIASKLPKLDEEVEGEGENEEICRILKKRKSNQIKFDLMKIIESLTVGLYSRGVTITIFREGIQNAKDAYARAIYLLRARHKNLVTDLKESDISPDMKILVFVDYYIMKDYGEGMTEFVLYNHFFAIACSSKKGDIAALAGLIGRFGIGGLTNIKQASFLAVVSKNIYDGKVLFQFVQFGVGPNNYVLSDVYEVKKDNIDDLLAKFKHKGFTRELLRERLEKYGTTILTVLKKDQYLEKSIVRTMVDEADTALKYCEGNVQIEARLDPLKLEDVKIDRIEKEEFVFPKPCDAPAVNKKGIARRMFHEVFDLPVVRCEIIGKDGFDCKMKFDMKYEIGITEDKRIFVLFKGDGNMEKSGMKEGVDKYKMKDIGLLWVSKSNRLDIRFYSNKYLVMNFEKSVLAPCTGFHFTGDLNISNLNPLTNRDTLINSDYILIKSILERVQKSIWTFLKDDGVRIGSSVNIDPYVDGYCNLGYHWDVKPFPSAGPLLCHLVNGEGVFHETTFQSVGEKLKKGDVEKVVFCSIYRSEMAAFATKKCLLVSISQLRGNHKIMGERFLTQFAKNINGFKFKNIMDATVFLSYKEAKKVLPNLRGEDHAKLISLYKASSYILYDDFYFRCPHESVKIKFGEAEGVDKITFLEHSRRSKSLDVYINVSSSRLIEMGEIKLDLFSYYRIIFLKYFSPKFGMIIGNYCNCDDYNAPRALGKKKMICSTFRTYLPSHRGRGKWDGPEEDLIEFCGTGYYLKIPLAYSSGDDSWVDAFNCRDGKSVTCVHMTDNCCNILLDYHDVGKGVRSRIQYLIIISDTKGRKLDVVLPRRKVWEQDVYHHWLNKIYLPIPKEFFPYIVPENGVGVEISFEMKWCDTSS